MEKINRKKRLSKEYVGIEIDQNNLFSIAKIIQDTLQSGKNKIDIQIESSDGEDTFHSDDPEIFFSKKLPKELKSIEIMYRYYDSPIQCSIILSTESYIKAGKLTVEGEDITSVTGLYHQLDKELKLLIGLEKYLIKVFRTYWFNVLMAFLIGYGLYLILDFALEFFVTNQVEFKNTSFYNLIDGFAWGLVIIGGISLSRKFEKFLEKAYPPVRFTGKFTDVGFSNRKRLKWVILIIILPIILEIVIEIILKGT
ncbi:hypothetical protein [uncultured Cyclobacterium sp.]|uniref:hypothetical protein n=1 Tax=uncultured Cyclobacterium sp. TaxID=453820 RepID=UPI0030EDF341